MFFYISFLRPPPSTSPPSSTAHIRITPQIANDLRTESFSASQDIFYSWVRADERTRAVKLTTWRIENAYKEILISPPNGVKEGQRWKLLLTPTPSASTTIDLHDLSLREVFPVIFPVISMPILFTRHAQARKQEEIERVYSLGLRKPIRIKEQTSFDLDKKIWDSGIGLSSWLTSLVVSDEDPLQGLRGRLFNRKSTKIIELGSGTGIVSIVLAALQSQRNEEQTSDITTTDLPSAIPLLESNISHNSSLYPSPPKPAVLDWDDPIADAAEDIDVVLMADVTYNTSSFPSLVRTLTSLTRGNTMVLMGYKQRDEAERSLWGLVKEKAGIEFVQVGNVGEVEIWIGSKGPRTS